MKHKQVAGLLSDPRFVRKRAIWTVVSIVVVLLMIAAVIVTRSQTRTVVKLGTGTFSARIAKTDAARMKGLAGVTALSANQAMLLAFKTDARWQVWMKDMKIPLDIVWLNNDKKVVYIVPDAPYQAGTGTVYTPSADTRYILELPAGTVARDGITIGQTAKIGVILGEIE